MAYQQRRGRPSTSVSRSRAIRTMVKDQKHYDISDSDIMENGLQLGASPEEIDEAAGWTSGYTRSSLKEFGKTKQKTLPVITPKLHQAKEGFTVKFKDGATATIWADYNSNRKIGTITCDCDFWKENHRCQHAKAAYDLLQKNPRVGQGLKAVADPTSGPGYV